MKKFVFTFVIAIVTATLHGAFAQLANNKVSDLIVSNEDGNVTIQWNMEKEINTRCFIIEKSVNGSEYEKTGVVNAAGSSKFPTSYSFIDSGNTSPEATYRVKIIYMEGTNEMSKQVVYKQNTNDKTIDNLAQK